MITTVGITGTTANFSGTKSDNLLVNNLITTVGITGTTATINGIRTNNITVNSSLTTADTVGSTTNIVLRNMTILENSYTGIAFKNGILADINSGHQASIQSGHLTGGKTYLSFRTNNTSSGNVDDEAMRITAEKYVGIGTSLPQYSLDVNGTANINTNLLVGNLITTVGITGTTATINGIRTNNINVNNLLTAAGITGSTFNVSSIVSDNIIVNNNIGIGTTAPTYALEITKAGITLGFTTGWRYGSGSAAANPSTGATSDINIKTISGIWATIFYATSDRRIKENIQDIDDENALEIIRSLRPVTYEYIDKVNKYDGSVFGFIAQEVKDILPQAVKIERDFIPNIYDIGDFEINNNNTIITLRNKNVDLQVGSRIRIIDLLENNYDFIISQVINQSSFVIASDITLNIRQPPFLNDAYINNNINNNTIFVYGTYVDDINILDKNSIYSVGVAATQQIDRKVINSENNIQLLQNKVSLQETIINDLNSKLTNLQDQFNALKTLLENNNII